MTEHSPNDTVRWRSTERKDGHHGRQYRIRFRQRAAVTAAPLRQAPFAGMLGQLHDLVEPLTRYSLDSLEVRVGEMYIAAAVAVATASVRFEVRTSTGAGEAPGSARACPSPNAVHSAAQSAVNTLRAGVPARLTAWSAGQPLDARLQAGACHDGLPAFGATVTCESCRGKGSQTCGRCGGAGQDRCSACDGRGNARCGSCSNGRQTCHSCGGQRGRNVQHANGNGFHWEQCWTCGGSGGVSCTSCGGRGTRACFSCSGGWVRCNPCSGSGRVTCDTCRATGSTHLVARVHCEVSNDVALHLQGNDADLAGRLSALPLPQLLAFSSVTARTPMVQGERVERVYDVRTPCAELLLPVAGEEIRFIGFGRNAEITDFRNVVGALLSQDLHRLRETRLSHPWLTLRVKQDLERAIEIVLDSEANEDILRTAPRAAGANAVSAAMHGAISADYVRTLQREFPAALRRAVAGPMGLRLLGAALAAVLVAFALVELGWRLRAWTASWQPPLLTMVLIAGATVGGEWWARRTLAADFDGPSWTKMKPLLGRFRIALTLRLAVLGTAVVMAGLLDRLSRSW